MGMRYIDKFFLVIKQEWIVIVFIYIVWKRFIYYYVCNKIGQIFNILQRFGVWFEIYEVIGSVFWWSL